MLQLTKSLNVCLFRRSFHYGEFFLLNSDNPEPETVEDSIEYIVRFIYKNPFNKLEYYLTAHLF